VTDPIFFRHRHDRRLAVVGGATLGAVLALALWAVVLL
jgi:hypothetical protein